MKKFALFVVVGLAFALLVGCATTPESRTPGTIRVSVFYPNEPGKSFDVGYYRDIHMPMAEELLAPYGLLDYGIDAGIAGGEPGQPAPFICIGWMRFGGMHGRTLAPLVA